MLSCARRVPRGVSLQRHQRDRTHTAETPRTSTSNENTRSLITAVSTNFSCYFLYNEGKTLKEYAEL